MMTMSKPKEARRSSRSGLRNRRGVAGTWVAVTLVTLLGMAALAIDVGRLTIAAQRAQDMADSAALAGATRLPYTDTARATALRTVLSNNDEGVGMETFCASEDIVFYGPTETVPNYGELGAWAHAMTVTTRVPVEYGFANVVGISGAVAERSCTVMRAPSAGVPICTMWIAHNTPLQYGVQQQLLMADGPHCSEIPGSFGFLQSPAGCTATWDTLLQGYPLDNEDIETAFLKTDDSVWAKTGINVGLFFQALEANGEGTARMQRALWPKWEDDTFTNYIKDNPRILLIPMVTYLDGEGSGAEFRIERFGAFWLEDVQGGQKIITGRFIEYDLPGGDTNNNAQFDDRVFSTKMLR